MLRKLRPRSIYDVFALLALIVAVGGTSAYAANTVFSSDIVDGEVKSVDIGDAEIKSADVKDQSLTTFDVSTFLGADVVDGTLTGADIQDSSLTGLDIDDGSVEQSDIANDAINKFKLEFGAVETAAVNDGRLNDEDIAQTLGIDFAGTIGMVNATSCVNKPVSGLSAMGDHLLLTPSLVDANPALMYDARYDTATQNATIHVCNFSTANIDDGTTHFNLLVVDAQ
jgi:hypothetical protein